MNRADADGNAQQITQELHDAAIGAAAHQRQRDDHLPDDNQDLVFSDSVTWLEEAVFGLQMPRRNRRPVMAGFRFEGGSVGRRPASPGQAWRG